MWAQEESWQLRELKERLGAAARLESEHANSAHVSAAGDSSSFIRSREENQIFPAGSRVRVIRGRHFRDFGAGDAGIVLQSDSGGGTCTVAFDRAREPLQVAVRHLELELRRSHRSGEQALNDSSILDPAVSSRLDVSRSDLPERPMRESEPGDSFASSTALERARLRLAESGTAASSSSRRAVSVPPVATFGPFDVQPISEGGSLRVSPQERATFRPERASPVEDALRQQAAELRRAAEAAAAAEMATRRTRGVVMSEIDSPSAAETAHKEAQELAAAVQASATATATATANVFSEVSSLRLSVADFQASLRAEAEQRAASFRAIEEDIAKLQAQHKHHYMEAEDSVKAEQKRLSRKQAELVSLCLSLQKADDPKFQTLDTEVNTMAERVVVNGQRLDTLLDAHEVLSNKVSATEAQVRDNVASLARLAELERCSHVSVERLDKLSALVDALALDLKSDSSEKQRSTQKISERLDAFSGRVDALVKDLVNDSSQRFEALSTRVDNLIANLNGKADAKLVDALSARVEDRKTDTMIDGTNVDALTMRVDRLTEKLTSETKRLEEVQTQTLQDLQELCTEQLQRFSDEADRRIGQLRQATASSNVPALEAGGAPSVSEASYQMKQMPIEREQQEAVESAQLKYAPPSNWTWKDRDRQEAAEARLREIGFDNGAYKDKEDTIPLKIENRPPSPARSPEFFKMTPVTTSRSARSPSFVELQAAPSFVSSSGYASMMASPPRHSFTFRDHRSPTPPPMTEPLARWAVGQRSSVAMPRQPQALAPPAVFTPPAGGASYSVSGPPMQCPACGAAYMPDSRFCRHCGQKRVASVGPVLGTAYGGDFV